MNDWWNSLALALQVFYAIGILSGLLLLIEAGMTLVGFGSDHMADVGVEHPDDLGVLSVRTITGFFFGFGWTGVIGIENGLGLVVSLLAATLIGVLFLAGVYLLMKTLFSMRSSGTLDYRNAVGQPATVYVTIPAAKSGAGQVEVLVQSRLCTVAAMSPHTDPLKPGAKVRVTGTIDATTLEVEPV